MSLWHAQSLTMRLLARTTVLLSLLLCIPSFGSAHSRGGGANLMNSPGYQRALKESRERYLQESQPYTKPPAVYPRKKWRHRGRR